MCVEARVCEVSPYYISKMQTIIFLYNSIENTERHAERFELCFSERKILFQSEKKKKKIEKKKLIFCSNISRTWKGHLSIVMKLLLRNDFLILIRQMNQILPLLSCWIWIWGWAVDVRFAKQIGSRSFLWSN